MACTCLGDTHGSSRCYEIDDPEQCAHQGIGCSYQPGPCPTCTTTPFLTRQLITPFPDQTGMTAIYVEAMDTLFDVRDLLIGSQIGDRLIEYNSRFADHALRIVEGNPDLANRVVSLLMQAGSFSRAITMELASGGRYESRRTFTEDQFAAAEQIADELDKALGDAYVSSAIAEVRDLARGLVGLTPAEVLHRLGLDRPTPQRAE